MLSIYQDGIPYILVDDIHRAAQYNAIPLLPLVMAPSRSQLPISI